MSDHSIADAPKDEPRRDAPKPRQCLRCQAAFPSDWAGERICSRCKGSNAWRTGALPRSGFSGFRR